MTRDSSSFADIAHQALSFSPAVPSQDIVLKLISTRWVQRLRDVSQTANTRLVYMFSEHSRFGHSLGVAYLAETLMNHLALDHGAEVAKYRSAIAAAALLHDIGHMAPGSHTAYKAWFPGQEDKHEEFSATIIRKDPEIQKILGAELSASTISILNKESNVPPWTWEMISGGGWNVDRGNWCIVDSIMAGVQYGKYNIPALTDSIVITSDGHLALKENRLDAMMHFAVSRHAMYRQIYQHRVILAADMLNKAIVQRARDLQIKGVFADPQMEHALSAKSPQALTIEDVFQMREPWWRYHLLRWSSSPDNVLADLADRLLHRRLLKTIRVENGEEFAELRSRAEEAVRKAGFDPRYYLHEISTLDTQAGDLEQSMGVMLDNGKTKALSDADPLFNTLLRETKQSQKRWLALPAEAKAALGRAR